MTLELPDFQAVEKQNNRSEEVKLYLTAQQKERLDYITQLAGTSRNNVLVCLLSPFLAESTLKLPSPPANAEKPRQPVTPLPEVTAIAPPVRKRVVLE